ncbi:MAG: hypothetical protein JXB29_06270 [Sedimentisphaerales bacterium]|nr:hypothetical protein [Sedimentisphaerales bacterium]
MKKREVKTISLIWCLWLLQLLPAETVSAGAEVNQVSAKLVNISVRADVNEVYFDNFWVFTRSGRKGPWRVEIKLPKNAAIVSLDEPNQVEFLVNERAVRKRMSPTSAVDSVGFSFALPNKDGFCKTNIEPGYDIDAIAVNISGPGTKMASNVLELDRYRTSRSKFSRVYTAGVLAEGSNVTIGLSSLPCRDNRWVELVCIVGLALIGLAALFTIYYYKRIIKESNICNETSSK